MLVLALDDTLLIHLVSEAAQDLTSPFVTFYHFLSVPRYCSTRPLYTLCFLILLSTSWLVLAYTFDYASFDLLIELVGDRADNNIQSIHIIVVSYAHVQEPKQIPCLG